MMPKVTTTQTRRNRVRRAIAAQNPLQHPPLRWWHLMAAVIILALAWLAVRAPGLLADVASYPLAGWETFVIVRCTVIILSAYALLFVRSYHPLIGFGLFVTAAGLLLRVGLNQVTEEPLSLGFALLLLALGLIAVRVIIRPNAEDTVRMLQERLGEK
jgi:hypothetical protein